MISRADHGPAEGAARSSPSAIDGRRRVVIAAVRPELDGGRYPVKRVDRRRARGRGRSARRRPRRARRARRLPSRSRERVERAAAGSAGQRPLARRRSPLRRLGRFLYTVESWVDEWASFVWAFRRKVEAQQDVSRRAPARRRAPPRHRRARRRRARRSRRRARRSARPPPASPTSAPTRPTRAALVLDPAISAAVARHPDRRCATRHARVLAVVVDPRARALLVLVRDVPALDGAAQRGRARHLRDVEARLPLRRRRWASTSLYLPPIHPIGRTLPQGPEQRARPPAPTIPAARGRSAPPTAGTRRPPASSARSTTSTASSSRARALGHRDRARHRLPGLARPPVGARAPRVVRAPRPTARIQYAENPPKKYQDIYPFDFECERLARAVGRADARLPLLDRAGRAHLPRRQPAHQAARASGSGASRERQAAAPRGDLPRRGVHAPEGDVRSWPRSASRSRTPTSPGAPPSGELTDYLTELTRTEVARVLPAELLAEHARTSCPSTCSAAGAPRSCARLVLAATLSASYGIYGPPFELHGARRARARRRGVPRHREVPDARTGTSSAPTACATSSRASTASAARTRRCTTTRGLRFHPIDNDHARRLQQGERRRRNVVLVVVNLDPHHAQTGVARPRPRRARASTADETFQVHDLLGDARYLWRGARATTSSSIPQSCRRTSSACAGASAPSTTSSTSYEREPDDDCR